MIKHHLAKLRLRHEISAAEEAGIYAALGEVRSFGPREIVVRAETLLTHSTLLLDGMMCRFKDLKSGERQIAELHIAGDFVDLHSFVLQRLDHEIMAITRCQAVFVPHDRLRHLTETFPHLARIYWFSTALDAAIHREWVLSLGRRSALARLAALFCELRVRLEIVGMAERSGFVLPLNQMELAECMGLTTVHVNRTLRDLREASLLTFRNKRVEIHDLPGLEKIAEFDPFYLYPGRQPPLD